MTTATKTRKTRTKKVTTATPAQMLAKMETLTQSISYNTVKIHRQKNERDQTTYLYFETVKTLEGRGSMDIAEGLSAKLGETASVWMHRRERGQCIRDHGIDIEVAAPASIAQVAGRNIPAGHMAKIVALINKGAGPSDVLRLVTRTGYAPLRAVPLWEPKAIRRHKHDVSDWEPEFERMVAGVQHTKGISGNKIEIVLKVNGRERLAVSNRRK